MSQRRQRAWAKGDDLAERRRNLPGLNWQTGSVLVAGRPVADALADLKHLWLVGGNVGALRDTLWLCGHHDVALPAWVAKTFDRGFTDPRFTNGLLRRWADYESDMIDLHRFDLFYIARAHGLSREEAAEFVQDAENEAGRAVNPSRVMRLSNDVPKRAKQNKRRYYIAQTFDYGRLVHPIDQAITRAQKRLTRRTPGRLFVRRVAQVSR